MSSGTERAPTAEEAHDILMLRSVGAMAIAEGDEGWQRIKLDCPMLVAVAKLRRDYDALAAPPSAQARAQPTMTPEQIEALRYLITDSDRWVDSMVNSLRDPDYGVALLKREDFLNDVRAEIAERQKHGDALRHFLVQPSAQPPVSAQSREALEAVTTRETNKDAIGVDVRDNEGVHISLAADDPWHWISLECARDLYRTLRHGYLDLRDHSDNVAVDKFADAMKAKLAKKRGEGRSGWDDPDACSVESLARMLMDHLPKGDTVDIGNFAMMLFNRGYDATLLRSLSANVGGVGGAVDSQWVAVKDTPIPTTGLVDLWNGRYYSSCYHDHICGHWRRLDHWNRIEVPTGVTHWRRPTDPAAPVSA